MKWGHDQMPQSYPDRDENVPKVFLFSCLGGSFLVLVEKDGTQ